MIILDVKNGKVCFNFISDSSWYLIPPLTLDVKHKLRKCRICGLIKSHLEFKKDKRKRFGIQKICKLCDNTVWDKFDKKIKKQKKSLIKPKKMFDEILDIEKTNKIKINNNIRFIKFSSNDDFCFRLINFKNNVVWESPWIDDSSDVNSIKEKINFICNKVGVICDLTSTNPRGGMDFSFINQSTFINQNKNIRIFATRIPENDSYGERLLFLAFPVKDLNPQLLGYISVYISKSKEDKFLDGWIDWIEVYKKYQRQGIATLLYKTAARTLDTNLKHTASSLSGQLFLNSIKNTTKD